MMLHFLLEIGFRYSRTMILFFSEYITKTTIFLILLPTHTFYTVRWSDIMWNKIFELGGIIVFETQDWIQYIEATIGRCLAENDGGRAEPRVGVTPNTHWDDVAPLPRIGLETRVCGASLVQDGARPRHCVEWRQRRFGRQHCSPPPNRGAPSFSRGRVGAGPTWCNVLSSINSSVASDGLWSAVGTAARKSSTMPCLMRRGH